MDDMALLRTLVAQQHAIVSLSDALLRLAHQEGNVKQSTIDAVGAAREAQEALGHLLQQTAPKA